MDKIIKHFEYPTSWLGVVVAVGSLFGFVLTPEYQQQIAAVVASIVSVIHFGFSDTDVKPE